MNFHSLNPENFNEQYRDSQVTAPHQEKHHSLHHSLHKRLHTPRHKSKPYYISHKVLRDNVVASDYTWATNHINNLNNVFQSMEPLWQTTTADDPLQNKIVSGKCKKAIKKLYQRIKDHHLYWDEATATTEDTFSD